MGLLISPLTFADPCSTYISRKLRYSQSLKSAIVLLLKNQLFIHFQHLKYRTKYVKKQQC